MPADERYRRQVALLVRILPFVAKEKCFALKGGTAINLFFRNLPRLSVDIDLAYLPVHDGTKRAFATKPGRDHDDRPLLDHLRRLSSRARRPDRIAQRRPGPRGVRFTHCESGHSIFQFGYIIGELVHD